MADVYTTRRMEETEEKDHLMQLVGFMNGREMFGVDILMVQEIIRGAPITADVAAWLDTIGAAEGK